MGETCQELHSSNLREFFGVVDYSNTVTDKQNNLSLTVSVALNKRVNRNIKF